MHEDPGFSAGNDMANLFGGKHGGKGHIAAGQGLAETEDIGGDPGMIAAEQLAAPAESGGDLIGDQQNLEFVAQLAHPAQIFWMIEPHPPAPWTIGSRITAQIDR